MYMSCAALAHFSCHGDKRQGKTLIWFETFDFELLFENVWFGLKLNILVWTDEQKY